MMDIVVRFNMSMAQVEVKRSKVGPTHGGSRM